MRPAHGILRLTRTALLAAACTGLAWGGHDPWASSPASVGGFVAATAALLPVLWYFTRTMRGFGDIFAVMASAQVLLHLILQGSALPGPAFLFTGVDHSGHGLLTHVLGFTPGMLFGHLWAALLASALLAHGETALWSLAALFLRALPALRAPDLAFAFPPRPPVDSAPVTTGHLVLSAHGPRGPPVERALPEGSRVNRPTPRCTWRAATASPVSPARGPRRNHGPVRIHPDDES